MTVLVNYITGSSKLFLDAVSIEESEGILQITYPSGSDLIPNHHIRDVRISVS